MPAVCDGTSNEHADAVSLAEFLMEHDSKYNGPQDVIARKMDWLKSEGRGMYAIDTSRYHRARQHLHERVDRDDNPCCGFRIHYRKSGLESELHLIDPSGDLGSHAKSAMSSIQGYISRKRQHDTEDRRMTETFRAVARHCLSKGDLDGAELYASAASDIRRLGAITPQTMADIEVWLATA
jgi:hypothetical protein